jgi:hypothetical protein
MLPLADKPSDTYEYQGNHARTHLIRRLRTCSICLSVHAAFILVCTCHPFAGMHDDTLLYLYRLQDCKTCLPGRSRAKAFPFRGDNYIKFYPGQYFQTEKENCG